MVSFPPLKPKWNERDLPLIEDRIGFPTPSREALEARAWLQRSGAKSPGRDMDAVEIDQPAIGTVGIAAAGEDHGRI